MESQVAFAAPNRSSVTRGVYDGTGLEMLTTCILGFLLTLVTLGLGMPWYIVMLQRHVNSKTQLLPTPRGALKLDFDGTGGKLFVIGLVGGLLTLLTLGLYGPWWLASLIRYFTDHTTAKSDDGTRYRLRFNGTGGRLFVVLFVGLLLTVLTLGIYGAWFVCNLNRALAEKTEILENDRAIGGFDFVGSGGEFFVTFLVGLILSVITFGIYSAWFQVKLNKFLARSTRITINGRTFASDFDGEGLDLFILNIVGTILSCLTLGIYHFWYMVKLIRFDTEHRTYLPLEQASQRAA